MKLDYQRTIERVADRLIDQAVERGAFNNLPGAGQPLPDIDEPFDEQRWVRRWIKRERLDQDTLAKER